MSSASQRRVPDRRPRKQDRTANRTAYWVDKMQSAPDGAEAIKQALSWALGAVSQVEDRRGPKAAEAARYHLARMLALFAAQSREANPELRPGLTDAEVAILFNPWGEDQ